MVSSIEAPPSERCGNSRDAPTVAAPHPYSTRPNGIHILHGYAIGAGARPGRADSHVHVVETRDLVHWRGQRELSDRAKHRLPGHA